MEFRLKSARHRVRGLQKVEWIKRRGRLGRQPTKGGRPKRQRTTAPPSFPGSLPVKTTRREGI
ncbi:hypothetical protein TSUD_335900 [Trifolium subterraneum]|uniref:Uncharacterized protein n=1 Tax=Trifolium subterraneum TaxID=3900 RepID=A0A2Z6LN94_TRISU|nr:hypothetical protein TSUD_335900 [Trifolium subterraneum]